MSKVSKASINLSSNISIEKSIDKTLKSLAKKKKHKPNPVARRRLRSAIIAVYFSIFIRSFGRKIYQNKLKNFIQEYPHEVGKYYDRKDNISKFKAD